MSQSWPCLGRTKNKSRSEVEALRGRIRSLEKELKYHRRRSHIDQSIVDDMLDGAPVEDVKIGEPCPDCGKGQLFEIDLGFLTLKRCDVCEYKTKKR